MALRPLPLLNLVFLLTLLRVSEERKYLKSFAGPFWIAHTRYYDCPVADAPDPYYNLSLRFLNTPRSHLELQRVTAHGEFKRALTDNMLTTLEADVWANNEWKENAIAKMSFPRFACSAYRKFVPDLAAKMYKLDVNSNEPCVVPAGSYSMVNTPVNWTIHGFSQFFYGLYRAKVKVYDGNIPVYCYVLETRVMPRPT